mmetsp:Transcript_13677/g.19600  ORF Transcript_13677/g.19600 Transcript_13677/m.19600 type:complete len:147 (+) Transcript_13677:211-651(+)
MDALQQQIQELQQALNALQAQQAQQAGGQAPPPAAVFARAPAQLNHAALLNYTDKKDIELHKSGSAALPGDRYDGKGSLQSWLSKVESRARSFGMLPILTINGNLSLVSTVKSAGNRPIKLPLSIKLSSEGMPKIPKFCTIASWLL